MAEANVEMVAYGPISDPHAGLVQNGDLFTTDEKNAKFYRKANWAGAPGTDPRDIQMEVAAEEYQRVKDARGQARDARQVFRNLGLHSAQRGNAAAVDVMPQSYLLPQGEKARTNSQQNEAEGGDTNLVPQQQAGEAGNSGSGSGDNQDYNSWDVPSLRQEYQDRFGERGSGKNKAELVEALEADDQEKQNQ